MKWYSIKKTVAEYVASVGHEGWQKTYRAENPGVIDRWKPVKDDEWFAAQSSSVSTTLRINNGVPELDILNRSYSELSPAWQAENLANGQVVAKLLADDSKINYDPDLLESYTSFYAEQVHMAWLLRNPGAPDHQKVSFLELSETDQEKDRLYVRAGIRKLRELLAVQ